LLVYALVQVYVYETLHKVVEAEMDMLVFRKIKNVLVIVNMSSLIEQMYSKNECSILVAIQV
jgi:hypothetical protein